MRVCTLGRFTIIAAAIRQGDRWGAAFKVRVEQSNYDTVDLLDETFLDATFEDRDDAEDAAFQAGMKTARGQLDGRSG